MDQRLSLPQIEAILDDHLQPYRCECKTQLNRTLSIRVYGEPSGTEELTVLGVTDDECRDAAHLVRLANELKIELFATRGVLEAHHE